MSCPRPCTHRLSSQSPPLKHSGKWYLDYRYQVSARPLYLDALFRINYMTDFDRVKLFWDGAVEINHRDR